MIYADTFNVPARLTDVRLDIDTEARIIRTDTIEYYAFVAAVRKAWLHPELSKMAPPFITHSDNTWTVVFENGVPIS